VTQILFGLIFVLSAALCGWLAVSVWNDYLWAGVFLVVMALASLGYTIWFVAKFRPTTVVIGWNGVRATHGNTERYLSWPQVDRVFYTPTYHTQAGIRCALGIIVVPRNPATRVFGIPGYSFTKEQTQEMMYACQRHVPVAGMDQLMRWGPTGLPYQ